MVDHQFILLRTKLTVEELPEINYYIIIYKLRILFEA